MRTLLTTTATALLLITGFSAAEAATAATKTPPVAATAGPVEANANAMAADDQTPMKTTIRQQIQDQLTKSGYTNVQVMPSAFLVHATDKTGNPVAMVIGPDSFTTVTEVAPKTASASPAPTAPAPAAKP